MTLMDGEGVPRGESAVPTIALGLAIAGAIAMAVGIHRARGLWLYLDTAPDSFVAAGLLGVYVMRIMRRFARRGAVAATVAACFALLGLLAWVRDGQSLTPLALLGLCVVALFVHVARRLQSESVAGRPDESSTPGGGVAVVMATLVGAFVLLFVGLFMMLGSAGEADAPVSGLATFGLILWLSGELVMFEAAVVAIVWLRGAKIAAGAGAAASFLGMLLASNA